MNFNRVILVGRLTRDPEQRQFANGGSVASFGFAFTGSRKQNESTGEWEEEPCFIDCKAFDGSKNYGRKLSTLVVNHLHKGTLVMIEGRLTMEKWEAQDGSKKSKVLVAVENIIFAPNPKREQSQGQGQGGPSGGAGGSPNQPGERSSGRPLYDGQGSEHDPPPPVGVEDGEIPF